MATVTLKMLLLGEDRSASKALRGVGGEADKVASKSSKMSTGSKAALAAAGAAAAKFGKDSVDAYIEASESQRALEDAYKRYPQLADVNISALRDLGSAMQDKTRYDADDIAASQAVLAQYKLTGSQIETLTPLLADYARKTGREIPDAAKILGKAMAGKGKALADVGLKFKDTGSTAGNFDQVVKGLRENVGGFAEQEGSELGDRAEIMGNKFGDLQEAIGEGLLPILEDLVDVGVAALDWMEENPGKVKAIVTAVGILTAAFAASKLAIALQGAAATIAAGKVAFMTGVSKLAAGAQWLLNAALSANPIGLVIGLIAALALGLKYAWDNSETFRRVVTTAFEAIKKAAMWLWDNGIKPMVKFILQGFAWLTDGIASFLDSLGNIPGFGWAKDAANKMREAAGKAREFGDSLDALPSNVGVNFNVRARFDSQANKLAGMLNSNTRNAIDYWASGGRPTVGKLAMFGEQGPELWVPDGPGTVYNAGDTARILAGATGPSPLAVGGGGGVSIVINGALDPVAVGRQVREALLTLKRASGGSALGLA